MASDKSSRSVKYSILPLIITLYVILTQIYYVYNVLLTMKDVYANEGELDHVENVCLFVCLWTLTVPAGQSLVPVEV